MLTTVLLRDHVATSEDHWLIRDAEKSAIMRQMGRPDPMLARLQDYPVFSGILALDDLSKEGFDTLLALHVAAHEGRPRIVSKSLQIVLTAFVVMTERRVGSAMRTLTIDRVGPLKIVYEFTMTSTVDATLKRPKPAFKLVMLNS